MDDCSCFTLKRLASEYTRENVVVLNSADEFKISEINTDFEYDIKFENILDGEFEDYIIVKYGKDNATSERSIFNIKGGQSRDKKSDVAFIIFNKSNKEVSLLIGEIKDSINSTTFNTARKQMVSTLLDTLMLNSLFTLNKVPIIKILMVIFHKNEIDMLPMNRLRNVNSQRLQDTHPNNEEFRLGKRFTNYEWNRKKIAYSVEEFRRKSADVIDNFFSSGIENEVDLIPCLCHLNNDCYEPVDEVLDEIKNKLRNID